jgi:hypothetical protein
MPLGRSSDCVEGWQLLWWSGHSEACVSLEPLISFASATTWIFMEYWDDIDGVNWL